MNKSEIRKRLSGTKERVFDPGGAHNRALMEQMREQRRLEAMSWPKFDWVWEQPAKPKAGYHVGPGDPDWAWRKRDY
jgi:hypothetical protein